jgi:hypothetical protein
MEKLEVGKYYAAKNYKETGYNFPQGKYKLKIIQEGFPEKPMKNENELDVAKEQWLEGIEDTDQWKKDLEGNWYYFEFPENEEGIDFMWVPESVVIEVF